MKDVDVKVTKKVVNAEEVVNSEDKEPVFVEVKRDGIREYWKNLSFKKKLGLVLGTLGAAAGAAASGYFVGRAMTSKAETETLELPSDDGIETDEVKCIETDEVE